MCFSDQRTGNIWHDLNRFNKVLVFGVVCARTQIAAEQILLIERGVEIIFVDISFDVSFGNFEKRVCFSFAMSPFTLGCIAHEIVFFLGFVGFVLGFDSGS